MKANAKFSGAHRHQGGSSLLEVLIAVLIFSIGLMGLAGLQVVAMKANQSAMARSLASEAAYDLLDQLRANSRSVLNGTFPLAAWNTSVAALMPGGKGYVCRQTSVTVPTPPTPSCTTSVTSTSTTATAGSGRFFVIRVQWTQAGSGTLNTPNAALTQEQQEVTVVGEI
ncbi:MAG: type IV pilus modification protein PilV [Zoogloeaceae bacterium]|jgi:type IV pilus assembly protein PilV|nr:type IV pilus modification protein PilV [Zoogloeaceae bacterium]